MHFWLESSISSMILNKSEKGIQLLCQHGDLVFSTLKTGKRVLSSNFTKVKLKPSTVATASH